ncbi:type II toxin-antitoxin system HicB family antitoxin [Candidatus Poribacteria bacterium]
MERIKYTSWQDDDDGMWLGYLEEYPDYMTQGETLEELEENLRDIYNELNSGNISYTSLNSELQQT